MFCGANLHTLGSCGCQAQQEPENPHCRTGVLCGKPTLFFFGGGSLWLSTAAGSCEHHSCKNPRIGPCFSNAPSPLVVGILPWSAVPPVLMRCARITRGGNSSGGSCSARSLAEWKRSGNRMALHEQKNQDWVLFIMRSAWCPAVDSCVETIVDFRVEVGWKFLMLDVV